MTGTGITTVPGKPQKNLPDIWVKAAKLGGLLASVEIILGSFLHNLHIPLSGTFLAALGLTLLDEISLFSGSAFILVYVTLNIARYARSLKRFNSSSDLGDNYRE